MLVSLKVKFLLLLVLFTASMGLILWLNVQTKTSMDDEMTALKNQLFPVFTRTVHIKNSFGRIVRSYEDALVTGDIGLLQSSGDEQRRFLEDLNQIHDLEGESWSSAAERLRQIFLSYVVDAHQLAQGLIVNGGKGSDAEREQLDSLGRRVQSATLEIHALLDQVNQDARRRVDGALARERQLMREQRRQSLVIGIGSLVPFILLTLFLVSQILRPIAQLQKMTGEVAEGRLDPESLPRVTGKDEIAQLQASFVDMVRRLRDTTVSKDYVDHILTTLPGALLITNVDGDLLRANRAGAALLGLSVEDSCGHHIDEYLSETDRLWIYDRVLRAKKAVSGKQVELRCQRGHMPMSLSADAAKDSTSGQVYVVLVAYDISEMKKREADLVQARDAAEEALRVKGEFLANMSHEIRTPMNGIMGITDLLAQTNMEAEQQSYVRTIHTSATALLTIINDILDFAKIDAGKMTIEQIDFSVRSAVQDAVDLLARNAFRNGLEMTCLIEKDVPEVIRGDPGRLRQILLNLLGNAVKFTEQGSIDLRVSRSDGDQTDMEWEDRIMLSFTVSDTGCGITPDDCRNIFESFSQADNSSTRRHGGTGLGLAICRRLAELMGGTITVNSVIGQGSSFTLSLPFDVVNDVCRVPSTVISGVRALIVDDNPNSREVLRAQLERQGMQLTCVGDLALASQFLQSEAVSVVVVDARDVPNNGQAWKKLIADQNGPDKPAFVLLSADAEREQATIARELGFRTCLGKPVREEALVNAIAMTIDPASQRPESTSLITQHLLPITEAHRRTSVLLVEDNLINQKVAQRMLDKLELRHVLAENGEEAVAQVQEHKFDLVLMDCQMPVLDGYEATRLIRRLEGRRGLVPIVALTANAMVGDREKCLAAGMNDYLSKPLRLEDLQMVIDKWALGNAPETSNIGLVDAEEVSTEQHLARQEERRSGPQRVVVRESPPTDTIMQSKSD